MRRRTRSVDRGGGGESGSVGSSSHKNKKGLFGRRARSVERPNNNSRPLLHKSRSRNALLMDDDDDDDNVYQNNSSRRNKKPSRNNNNNYNNANASTVSGLSNDYLSGDDDSYYSKTSKKSNSGRKGWFGGGGGGGNSNSYSERGTSKSRSYRPEEIDVAPPPAPSTSNTTSAASPYSKSLASVHDIERLAQKRGANPVDERFKVMPDTAYPNTYMNRDELRQEMNAKSVYFHDVRPHHKRHHHHHHHHSTAEVGQLRVEILQCFGLPATSLVREVSAYCVAVCGNQAFQTDVMPPVANPMWLSKMRRAALFSLQHLYAKVYIGVFDNHYAAMTSETGHYDFVGRIAIDVSRLRPNCSYDITLPLRQSTHVFTREQHGAIRVRLHMVVHAERTAILTYLPNSLTNPTRLGSGGGGGGTTPNESMQIPCLDEQSFRNVAYTVHGVHMPGKFSMTLLKSTVREIQFTRIHLLRYIRNRELWNLMYWKYPLISGFLFLAWMHACYYSTVRYIPGHILTVLLLHLYKNYAYYGMDSPLQNGFLPPTLEELWNGLLFGTPKKAKSKHYIEPLQMEADESHAINPEDHLEDAEDGYDKSTKKHNSVPLSEIAEALRKSIQLHTHKYRLKTYNNCFIGTEAVDFFVQFGYAYTRPEAVALGRKLARETHLFEHITKRYDFEDKPHYYHFLSFDTQKYVLKGHRPKFKRLLRALFGMSTEDDPLMATRGHVEFPFATGADHPRFTVKEALVIRSNEAKKLLQEKRDQLEIVECAEFGVVPAPATATTTVAKGGQQFITNAAGEVVNVAATLTTGVVNVGMGAVGVGIGAVGVGIGAVRAGVRRASLLGQMPTTPAAEKEIPAEVVTADTPATEEAAEKTEKPKRRLSLGGTKPPPTPATQQLDAAGNPLAMVVSSDPDDIYSKLKSRNNPTLDELLEQQETADAYDEYAFDADNDVQDMFKKKSKGYIIEEKILKKPPNQDMSVKNRGSADKSFAKTMAEARHRVHGLFLHLFNDRAYAINQEVFPPTLVDDAAERAALEAAKAKKKKKKGFFGVGGGGGGAKQDKEDEEEEEKKRKKRQVTPYDAKVEECDKILGINKYSHANPWINRVGIVVQPIVEIFQSFLCFFRALFNIFTWQDPILSFWIAILGPVVVLVLHIMPYRIIFFCLGVAAVGPQNYLLRLFRESKGDPPPDFDKLFRKKKITKEDRSDDAPQFFSSAAPGNQNIKYVNVDPQQVRSVVVPYGPLKYNRFYDWPPEPEYARVYASAPPRNAVLTENGELMDDDDDYDNAGGFEVDARMVKGSKKKKKKKGIKKLASQVKKGTGTVVFAGGELAKRTQNFAGGAVMNTAHLTQNVAKGATHVAKGAVKGTVKGAAKTVKSGAKGVMKIGKRRGSGDYDYDEDDESY